MSAIKRLGDDGPMPFGKHKGKPLGDIPLKYFRWMWDNTDTFQKKTPLSRYVAIALGEEIPEDEKEALPPKEEARPRHKNDDEEHNPFDV